MAFVSHVPFQLEGRYADTNKWEVLNGPGDSRPTGLQIIQDEGVVDAWKDKVVLITGVSSGIGVETVRALAKTGATIYGTARNMDKAKDALGDLLNTGQVKILYMDQTDLDSVRACAEEFLSNSNTLNILINNAAVMNTPETRTKDGFELQFVTNHLSHFLLFDLLKDRLISSAKPQFRSRLINVTSAGHRYSPLQLDNLQFQGNYDGWLAYGSSKTANIYMADYADRLYESKGLNAYSVHPGSFVSPNLQKHSQAEMDAGMKDPKVAKYLSSLEQGCATTVYAAVCKDLEGKGALYLEGASVTTMEALVGSHPCDYGYASWVNDFKMEKKLWAVSEVLAGIVQRRWNSQDEGESDR